VSDFNVPELQDELRELYQLKEKLLKKKLYKENLYELCKLIGFNDLGECHKELCAAVENTEKKYLRRLFLYPRSHFKTSIISVANTVRYILNNPNKRVLIASSTLDNAKLVLKLIKSVFWQNEKFREIFPEYCPPENAKEFGNQLSFTVPNRTNKSLKEGTVEAVGDGGIVVGRHYDYIVLTDIVTYDNVNTMNRINSTIQWCAYALSLLDNPLNDPVTIEGTRYHYDDAYGHFMNQAKKNSRFYVMVRPALSIKNGEEVSLFPERFSVEGLRELEKEQGSYVFQGQYQLNPIDEGTATFKRNQIQYVTRRGLPRTDNNKLAFPLYMSIDPAISESTKADSTVLTISMFDDKNDEYVVDIRHGHWNITKIKNEIWKMYETYNPRIIGIEIVAFQKLFINIFDDMAREKKQILPVHELKRDTNVSKKMRITSLQPRFEQHKIWFCEDLDKGFIEEQILRFNPEKKHNKDDLLDTLADMEDIKIIPELIKPSKYALHPELRYLDWLKRTDRDEDEVYSENEEDYEEEYDYGYSNINM
jgi:hypothetical protein